jgi:hypothetical protein
MPHHFTKSTVEASIWCNRCNKETPWRIADGRRQYCLTCDSRKAMAHADALANRMISDGLGKAPEPVQEKMF